MKTKDILATAGLVCGLAAPLLMSAPAGAGASCLQEATTLLKQRDPDGYRIYQRAGAHKDAMGQDFASYLRCEDTLYNLPTAVHETLHGLDGLLERETFLKRGPAGRRAVFYVGAGEVVDVPLFNLFPRSEIAVYLQGGARDYYHDLYLAQNGAQDITGVLEEFNAYTHELMTSGRMVERLQRAGEGTTARDGVATFMLYTALYLKHARSQHPDQWRRLAQDDAYRRTIRRLWQRAEQALKPLMVESSLGLRDREILGRVFAPELKQELERYFRARPDDTFTLDAELATLAASPQPSLIPGELVPVLLPSARPSLQPSVPRRPGPSSAPVTDQNRQLNITESGGKLVIEIDGRRATPAELESLLEQYPALRNHPGLQKALEKMRRAGSPAPTAR